MWRSCWCARLGVPFLFVLNLGACTPAAQPSPTTAPSQPAQTSAAAEPASKPASTAVPAKAARSTATGPSA